MKNKISITTIILAVTLSKLYGKGSNDVLVEVIAAFRAALKSDHKAVCKCDLQLIELARSIHSDYGYLVEVA